MRFSRGSSVTTNVSDVADSRHVGEASGVAVEYHENFGFCFRFLDFTGSVLDFESMFTLFKVSSRQASRARMRASSALTVVMSSLRSALAARSSDSRAANPSDSDDGVAPPGLEDVSVSRVVGTGTGTQAVRAHR